MYVNTDNTILLYGATRATPYLCVSTRTTLWGNTGNTILLYGAMRTTPYFSMGQHGQHHFDTSVCQRRQHHTSMGQCGQHHTYVWGNTINFVMYGNTGNTVLLYGCQHYTHCMKQYWQHYGYIHNSNMHRRHHAFMWQHM